MYRLLLIISVLVLSGCVSKHVDTVYISEGLEPITMLCIERNPKVTVPNFESDMVDIFRDLNVSTIFVDDTENRNECNYRLKYTARRSWDLVTFVAYAEFSLVDYAGMRIGTTIYRLRSGLDLTKYGSTKNKIEPSIKRLIGMIN